MSSLPDCPHRSIWGHRPDPATPGTDRPIIQCDLIISEAGRWAGLPGFAKCEACVANGAADTNNPTVLGMVKALIRHRLCREFGVEPSTSDRSPRRVTKTLAQSLAKAKVLFGPDEAAAMLVQARQKGMPIETAARLATDILPEQM